MAAAWPLALPQSLETDSFSKTIGNNVLRSSMDIGIDKLRKRYTKQINILNGQMKIDRAQYVILETFYTSTLSNGILPFTFVDPISQAATDYRFTSPPTFRSIGGNYFTVTLALEQLP